MFVKLPNNKRFTFSLNLSGGQWFLLILFAYFLMFFNNYLDDSHCKKVALNAGFVDYRFVPAPPRGGGNILCYGLTQADVSIKNKIPKGTRLY